MPLGCETNVFFYQALRCRACIEMTPAPGYYATGLDIHQALRVHGIFKSAVYLLTARETFEVVCSLLFPPFFR